MHRILRYAILGTTASSRRPISNRNLFLQEAPQHADCYCGMGNAFVEYGTCKTVKARLWPWLEPFFRRRSLKPCMVFLQEAPQHAHCYCGMGNAFVKIGKYTEAQVRSGLMCGV